jgi:hypothetical protein
MRGQRTTPTINNTRPRVPAGQIDRLLQPFRRLAPDRGTNDGHSPVAGEGLMAQLGR